MDLIKAFLPNAQSAGYSPFPAPLEERIEPFTPSLCGGFSAFSQCCHAAFNRTIITFCDPSVLQCKDAALQYVSAWRGDDAARRALASAKRQEVDPTALPWKPKPQYLEYLMEQQRLKPPASSEE